MSSVDDLLLWDENFYTNKLGRGALVKEMQTRGVLNNGTRIGYALGLELSTYRGLPIVEHAGGLFGYSTEILRFPEQRFAVVCLCNVSSAAVGSLSRNVADVFLENTLQIEVIAPPPPGDSNLPDSSAFAGKYLDPRTHAVYSFSASNGSLAAWGSSLKRLGPNRFRDLGSGIITFDNADGVMRISLDMDGAKVFSGSRVEEVHLGDRALAFFAGEYKSAELDATYKLSIDKGSLVLRNNFGPLLKLTPIAQDEFDGGDLGDLVFHRDANHRVSGFSLFSFRARNIGFNKVN
jgi:hypothetical protein